MRLSPFPLIVVKQQIPIPPGVSRELVIWIAAGVSIAMIAAWLKVSERTVKRRIARVREWYKTQKLTIALVREADAPRRVMNFSEELLKLHAA